MRKGKVFQHNNFAGLIEEDEEGFKFTYDDEYILSQGEPVSLTMPIRVKAYNSKTMFPFFDGLIPEGWLLNIAEKNWKVNSKDRMGLLLSVCKETIGSVSIVKEEEK
ncbi:MAG: HipA N-terminal domain-containing protein [Ignavibacteria bacterium]